MTAATFTRSWPSVSAWGAGLIIAALGAGAIVRPGSEAVAVVQPSLLARLGADDGAVRVSVGLGTTSAHVEAFLDALTVTCLSLRAGVAA